MKLRIYVNTIAALSAAIGGTYLCLNNEVAIGCLVLGSAVFSSLRAFIWYQRKNGMSV